MPLIAFLNNSRLSAAANEKWSLLFFLVCYEEPPLIFVLFCSCSAAAKSLVELLSDTVEEDVMSKFVQNFLLESNSTAVRWQAHELLHSMHK